MKRSKFMYTALDIAQYILYDCDTRHIGITNLKLQKMLFFLQVFYYCLKNVDLFCDDIEAWDCGLVVRDVYFEYRQFGYVKINAPNDKPALIDETDEYILTEFDKILENISASSLVEITFADGTLWERHYQKYHKNIIPREDIHSYAREMLK